MPILNGLDADIYFSGELIEHHKLSATIAFLTGIVEGELGARRPLEKRSHVEQQTLHLSQREYFVKGWPIDPLQPVAVEMRCINRRDRYRRPIGDSSWEMLRPNDYEVGEKSIRLENTNLIEDFNRRSFGSTSARAQIRLSYSGGFDFSAAQLTAEAIGIKYALGQLLEYHALNMGASTARIQSEDVFQESRISYFGSTGKSLQPGTAAIGGFPEYLLIPFHQYRPYQYRF